MAVDPGDDRLRAAVDGLPHVVRRGGVGDVLVLAQLTAAPHPVEVGAGAEHAASAGQDDHPRLVHRQRLEELGQLDDQLRAERVSHLRPVDGQRHHRPASFKPDRAHIRNTPNVVSGTGAQEAASSP
jgi:hypothetical protein